jgi:hypothetical protein
VTPKSGGEAVQGAVLVQSYIKTVVLGEDGTEELREQFEGTRFPAYPGAPAPEPIQPSNSAPPPPVLISTVVSPSSVHEGDPEKEKVEEGSASEARLAALTLEETGRRFQEVWIEESKKDSEVKKDKKVGFVADDED